MSAILSTFDHPPHLTFRAAIRAAVQDCRDELATEASALAKKHGGTLPPGIIGGLLYSCCLPTLDGRILTAIEEAAEAVGAFDLSEALLNGAFLIMAGELGPVDGGRLLNACIGSIVTDARTGTVDEEAQRVITELSQPSANALMTWWLIEKSWKLLFFACPTVEEADEVIRRQAQQVMLAAKPLGGGEDILSPDRPPRHGIVQPHQNWRVELGREIDAYRDKLASSLDHFAKTSNDQKSRMDVHLCEVLNGDFGQALDLHINTAYRKTPDEVRVIEFARFLLETACRLLVVRYTPEKGLPLFDAWACMTIQADLHNRMDPQAQKVVRRIAPGFIGADLAMVAVLVKKALRGLQSHYQPDLVEPQVFFQVRQTMALFETAGTGQRRVS